MNKIINFFALFGSVSTLICCALPATFVALGAGASFAGLVSSFPQFIWVSEHKDLIFILSSFFLGLSGYFTFFREDLTCPTDPKLRDACLRAKKVNKIVFFVALSLIGLGGFFSYLAPLFI